MTNQMWQDAETRYPGHVARIQRGRAILEAHLADPRAGIIRATIGADGDIRFSIRSQSNARGTYTVDAHGCTCPDWPQSQRCKHWIAVSVLRALIGA